MAACGVPEADIALVIGIAPRTLRKHFRDELDTGHIKASAKVAGNLYRIATGSGREAVTAAIFWLKVRAGWREPLGVREYPMGKKEAQRLAADAMQRDHPSGRTAARAGCARHREH